MVGLDLTAGADRVHLSVRVLSAAQPVTVQTFLLYFENT